MTQRWNRRSAREPAGVTAIEYSLLVALIALVTIAGINLTGVRVADAFTALADHFGSVSTTCDQDGNYIGPQRWAKLARYDDNATSAQTPDGTTWTEGSSSDSHTLVDTEWVGVTLGDAQTQGAGELPNQLTYSILLNGYTSRPGPDNTTLPDGSFVTWLSDPNLCPKQ